MKRFLPAVLFSFALFSCSVEVGFHQEIDLVYNAVQVETATNITVVVSEGALTAGLDSTGYALGDFDSLALSEARVVAVSSDSAWDSVDDFLISFRGDSRLLDVFAWGETVAGDSRDLFLRDDDMLDLIRSGSFRVESSAVLDAGAGQLEFRIILDGVLSTTVP